jgi:DNA segregation ATPase FtsK/SpoIIIE-like protein
LVAGATGSGKTVAQKMIVWGMTKTTRPKDLRVTVLDVTKKGRAWKEMEALPHFRYPVITGEQRALAIVKQAEKEVDERADTNRTLGEVPRHVLVIDELSDLVTGRMGKEFTASLSRISRLGREYAVNLCVATQYPLVKQLGDSVAKQQMGVRLVGRMSNSTAAFQATGQRTSGAESLTQEGDFIYVSNQGMGRFQVAFPQVEATWEGSERKFDPLPDLEDFRQQTTKMGRPIDELSPEVVGQLLVKGMELEFKVPSFHTVGSWVKPKRISAKKAERHWKFAERVYQKLVAQNYALSVS